MEQSSDRPEEARCGYCIADARRVPGYVLAQFADLTAQGAVIYPGEGHDRF
jgi:hypothetical protein